MADRETDITQFIQSSGYGAAKRHVVAGDASNRKYERLVMDNNSVILMDAPTDRGEDVQPFIAIAQHLCSLGLSAPKLITQDTNKGFLILEDLGDALFARVMNQTPKMEMPLYEAAVDVLLALHKHPKPDLVDYDKITLLEMADLAFEWYFPAFDFEIQNRQKVLTELRRLIEGHAAECDVLVQRDYHAENLIWLPERETPANVGLLDFQDAMGGHRAYDLVSLLQDARRDVSEDIEAKMILRYVEKSKQDLTAFQNAYHVLGVQRNLRILGVFVRLLKHNKKPHYIDFIPRVLGYIHRSLNWPVMCDLRADLLPILDIPDAEKRDCVKSA